jgi:hypothetical protein
MTPPEGADLLPPWASPTAPSGDQAGEQRDDDESDGGGGDRPGDGGGLGRRAGQGGDMRYIFPFSFTPVGGFGGTSAVINRDGRFNRGSSFALSAERVGSVSISIAPDASAPSPVPVPSGAALLAAATAGFGGLSALRRRRRPRA